MPEKKLLEYKHKDHKILLARLTSLELVFRLGLLKMAICQLMIKQVCFTYAAAILLSQRTMAIKDERRGQLGNVYD